MHSHLNIVHTQFSDGNNSTTIITENLSGDTALQKWIEMNLGSCTCHNKLLVLQTEDTTVCFTHSQRPVQTSGNIKENAAQDNLQKNPNKNSGSAILEAMQGIITFECNNRWKTIT